MKQTLNSTLTITSEAASDPADLVEFSQQLAQTNLRWIIDAVKARYRRENSVRQLGYFREILRVGDSWRYLTHDGVPLRPPTNAMRK